MTDSNPSGLNESYRDDLRGESDHKPSTRTTRRGRLRDRTRRTVCDGALIWEYLSADERRKVFDEHRLDLPLIPKPSLEDPLDENWVHKRIAIEDGIIGWLAFFYEGLRERPHPDYTSEWEPPVVEVRDDDGTIREETFDEDFEPSDPYYGRTFEELLENAMRRVASQHGWDLNENEFEVNITFDRDPDFEELQRRFENGVATIEEATKLRRRDEITTEEFAEYVDSLD